MGLGTSPAVQQLPAGFLLYCQAFAINCNQQLHMHLQPVVHVTSAFARSMIDSAAHTPSCPTGKNSPHAGNRRHKGGSFAGCLAVSASTSLHCLLAIAATAMPTGSSHIMTFSFRLKVFQCEAFTSFNMHSLVSNLQSAATWQCCIGNNSDNMHLLCCQCLFIW